MDDKCIFINIYDMSDNLIAGTLQYRNNTTCKIGYLLRNYAEIDNTNNKTKFHWPVQDLRVNGRKI